MRILLVEDLKSDAILLREALIDAGLNGDLEVVKDGAEAMERLGRSGPLPQLVLLDLNLPRVSGQSVLEAIRADPRLDTLPVVVISTSNSPVDIDFAYAHRANAYVRKPNGFEALVIVARSIRDFWTRTASLPSAYA
jgi:chemotaxis family two-component system response regulator Rcp1